MAKLDILVYPDNRLRNKARPVEVFDADLHKLVDDMAQTMYEAPGIGLAAVQVNRPVSVIVIDISEDKNDLTVLINPRIVASDGEIECEEGCLSVPEFYAPVSRAAQISVQAQDQDGTQFEFDAEGLLAVCIQHEMDHLKGIVFVDYLSRLKRDRVRKKLEKEIRRGLHGPDKSGEAA